MRVCLRRDALSLKDSKGIFIDRHERSATGETGTGKEVIAKTIHEYSRRSAMPFIALNCAAVPRDLLESQLFGHRKGAFSGATENYQGIAEQQTRELSFETKSVKSQLRCKPSYFDFSR